MDKISFRFPNHECITKTRKYEASQHLQNNTQQVSISFMQHKIKKPSITTAEDNGMRHCCNPTNLELHVWTYGERKA